MNNCLSVIRRKIVFILLITIIGQASAQVPVRLYSLKECIETALNNNINLRQRELNLQTGKADAFQSKMALLPSVNGSVTNNYNTGFAINPITNTTQRDVTFRSNNFSLNGSMVLFNGFQTTNNARLQEANVKASELDVVTAKNNLSLQVANAFMNVLLNTEILQARILQAGATAEQVKRQQQMYELGSLNKVRYLQIKAQLANEESQLVIARTQLDQSYLTLWQLMNIAPDTLNKIQAPPLTMNQVSGEIKTAEEIYRDFLARSPEVQAAKARKQSAHISYLMALGSRSPRLVMSGGFNSFFTTQATRGVGAGNPQLRQIGIDSFGVPVYSPFLQFSETEVVPFNEQFDRNLGKSLGFTLSIPIFNGWQVNTNIQRQRINQMSAGLTMTQTELDVYRNVNQAYLDFQSAIKRYDASLIGYDANKEAYLLAQQQFELGALNTADFLNTKNQYLQAETTLLQAKYELMFRRKVLDFYLGKSLIE
ncbi:MAG: TolC family protein [Bacteroidia bacterium]|jgi:outer membrane protein|nr:TolC family protein [Bacteroidia bacterium]